MGMNRRGFLFGLASAVAAVPAARLIKNDLWIPGKTTRDRKIFRFHVAADSSSPIPPNEQCVLVLVQARGQVLWPQLENLPFATSYIPTRDTAVTRAADEISISPETRFKWHPGQAVPSGMNFSRPTPKFIFNENLGSYTEIPPNVPAVEREGLLIEQVSTNFLVHSDDFCKWGNASQIVRLRPGEYTLSWHGEGAMQVRGDDLVWAWSSGRVVDVQHFPRKLSNDEIKRLTS